MLLIKYDPKLSFTSMALGNYHPKLSFISMVLENHHLYSHGGQNHHPHQWCSEIYHLHQYIYHPNFINHINGAQKCIIQIYHPQQWCSSCVSRELSLLPGALELKLAREESG
jgi:hypothetical protein